MKIIARTASDRSRYGRNWCDAVFHTSIGWPLVARQQNWFTAVWKRMPIDGPKIVPILKITNGRPSSRPSRCRSSSD